jgi:hypothetical protein
MLATQRKKSSLQMNAITTHAMRVAIHGAAGSDSALARKFGVSRDTIHRWRERDQLENLRSATLSASQEELVIYLRTLLRLPLDDLLSVVREFIEPGMSRFALDRLLHRRGQSRLSARPTATGFPKSVKACVPGHVQIDWKCVPHALRQGGHEHIFVAVDRVTRWVFVETKTLQAASTMKSCLEALQAASPFGICTLSTAKGQIFHVRPQGESFATTIHEPVWGQLSLALGIDHRGNQAQTGTSGSRSGPDGEHLAQCFRSRHFNPDDDPRQMLQRYVWLYNNLLPQKSLGLNAPVEVLARWSRTHPSLFKQPVHCPAGPKPYGLMLAGLGAFNFISGEQGQK